MDRVRRIVRWSKSLNQPTRIILATAVVGGAFVIRWLLDPWLAGYPYITFFLAIVFVSLILESGSGIFATALSAFLGAFFFIEPRYSLNMTPPVIAFLVTGLLITGLTEVFRKLVEQLDALEVQKDILLHELNHINESDPKVRDALGAVAERVANINRLHHHLFDPGSLKTVGAADFLRAVCHGTQGGLIGRYPVTVTCDAPSVSLDRDFAAGMGIIVNELITNALKYAFPEGKGGSVAVRLSRDGEGDLLLSVSDDGVGCPADRARGTGSMLVSAIARQHGGSVEWQEANPGCLVVVKIPSSRVRAQP